MCRNPLIAAGWVVSAFLIWWNSRNTVPQWTVWNVQLGSSLLVLAGPVLVVAQLAAGRVRRDGMEQIYDSFPASGRVRTAGLLLGLAGPLALAGVLAGAAVAWLEFLGPVGAPQLSILVQGPLLIALAGAAGVALGRYLPHPGAGVLTVVVLGAIEADLLVQFGAPVSVPVDIEWLLPWNQIWILGSLPGPVPVPADAHLAWLAALTALAGIVALARGAWRTRSPRLFAVLAGGTAAVLAVVGWSAQAEFAAVPAGAQVSLVGVIVNASQVQPCSARRGVRYCYFPGFQADVARWAAVVDGVFGQLPANPARVLVVRQVVDTDVVAYPLFSGTESHFGQLSDKMNAYLSALADDPRLFSRSSVPPVYVDLSWGAHDGLGAYQLSLALQTAWWVAGLPTTSQAPPPGGSSPGLGGQQGTSCLAVGQAREAIALWLAASATPSTRTAFPAALRYGPTAADTGTAPIAGYLSYPVSGYVPTVPFTAQGAALAEAMLRLPQSRVEAVLSGRWRSWLGPQATDARLAADLGIALPGAPQPARPRQPASSGLGARSSSPLEADATAPVFEQVCR